MAVTQNLLQAPFLVQQNAHSTPSLLVVNLCNTTVTIY